MNKKSITRKLSLKYLFKWLTYRWQRLFCPVYKQNWIILFRYTKALGDNLFLSTLAHEIKKRNPHSVIHVITGLPVLFNRNPNVDFVSPEPQKPTPHMGKYLLHYESAFPWKRNILHYCLDQVGIKDVSDQELKTYIYPDDSDYNYIDQLLGHLKSERIIVITTIAGPRSDKKNWPIEYWKELSARLLDDGNVIVKIGLHYDGIEDISFSHPKFLDLTGKISIHQSAALMSCAHLSICPVTGVLHLAAAFDLPSLAIVGGSEPGIATQFSHGHYIENRPACADCYEKGPCLNNIKCLTEISPDMVYEKALALMGKNGGRKLP
ncbi:MAG: glycosyltransferase family 9 protein [Marinilabiliaceae bacterium]|nr:glycosyltransferase family 9 protein [Marinilabiliaceae bacterium]